MKKAWRIILVIVLIAVLLAAVLVAVGMMTGADAARIYSVLDGKYHVTEYYQWAKETAVAIRLQLLA